jgi:hypothetical protein
MRYLVPTLLITGCTAGLVWLGGCTTFAPTEATTDTVGNTADTASEFTSSSSPGHDSGDSAQTLQFVRENYVHVKSDMARGGGEYLEALAELLAVAPDRREDFYRMTREQYISLYPSPDTSAREMLTRLNNWVLPLATGS